MWPSPPLLLLLCLGLIGLGGTGKAAGSARVNCSETIQLGGRAQYLLIRSDDAARNPVLLFLHGGPGFPGGSCARANASLERDFTVVHWDQRGTAHSYDSSLRAEPLRIGQLVSDALELTDRLRARFGQRKIYLVGHSWGSMLGMLAVARRPEWFAAFVSVGQLVDLNETRRLVTRARAGRPGSDPALASSEAAALDRGAHLRIALLTLTSPDYSPAQLGKVIAGFRYSSDALEDEITATNLATRVPRVEVPVCFITGRFDTVVTAAVAERYFRQLKATRGKRLVRFARSSHWPHLQQPEEFARQMRQVLAEHPPAQNRLRRTSPTALPVP